MTATSSHSFRAMRGWAAAGLVGIPIMLLGLIACSPPAKAGDPALPPDFESQGVPAVGLNAYGYFSTGASVAVPLSSFGEAGGAIGDAEVVRVEGLMERPLSETAVRVEFVDSRVAQAAAELAASQAGAAGGWAKSDDRYVMVGRPANGTWTNSVEAAWTADDRQAIADAYPDAWETLRLLPEEPPAAPVAAGFIRRVPEMAEEMLEAADVRIPGLSSALDLMRVETLAIGLYADNVERLPSGLSTATLREANLSALAVANAGYPGFVVDFLFPRFTERAGLEEADLDGSMVLYRRLDADLHLVMKTYGPTFYFAVAATREGAEDLMRSVMESQKARREARS